MKIRLRPLHFYFIFILISGIAVGQSAALIKEIGVLGTPNNSASGRNIFYDPTDNTLNIHTQTWSKNYIANCKSRLIKMDTCLNVLWYKEIPFNNLYCWNSMSCMNGKYSIYTSSNNQNGNYVASVVSFNQTGAIANISDAFYANPGTYNTGVILGSKRLPNGDQLLTGATNQSQKLWFLKLDANNNILWSKVNAGNNSYGWSFGISTDYNSSNEYFFAGLDGTFGTNGDSHLIKTDANGNVIWAKNYGHPILPDWACSVKAMNDGGAIFFSAIGGAGIWDIAGTRVDANGNVMWSKLYKRNFDDYPVEEGIMELPNGNILVTGSTSSSSGNWDGLLMVIDPNTGNIITNSVYVTPYYDYFNQTVLVNNTLFTTGCTQMTSGNINANIVKYTLNDLMNGTISCMQSVSFAVSNYTTNNYSANNPVNVINTFTQTLPAAVNVQYSTNLDCGQTLKADFNVPGNLCLNSCITLKDSSHFSPTFWQWTIKGPSTNTIINSQNINSYCFNTPGIHTIKLKVENCGQVDSLIKTINILGNPQVMINATSPTCVGDNLTLSIPSALSYTWTGPNGFTSNSQNPTIVNLTLPMSGVYSFTSTNNMGCPDMGTINITVHSPSSFTPGNSGIKCVGDNLTLFSNISASSYTWTGPNNFYSTLKDPDIFILQPTSAGIYTLTIQNNFGCISSAGTVVMVKPLPTVFFDSIQSGCPPVCVNAFGVSNHSIVTSYWYLNNIEITQNKALTNYCVSHSGTNNLMLFLLDEFGCANSFSRNFEIYSTPTASFVFSPYEPSYYNPTATLTDKSYGAIITSWYWQISDSVHKDVFFEQDLTYDFENLGQYGIKLIVESDKGCKDSVTKIINLDSEGEVYVPNSFTPNGDGLNDVFVAKGVGLKWFEMRIYDRWGNLLFTSTDIDTGWDGRSKKQLQANDIYVYQIKYENGIGIIKNKTGHVFLYK